MPSTLALPRRSKDRTAWATWGDRRAPSPIPVVRRSCRSAAVVRWDSYNDPRQLFDARASPPWYVGRIAQLLRQAGPGVARADDRCDGLHQAPRAGNIDARVQQHHHGDALVRQVVGVSHVALGVAVVADPAILVLERKPV